MVTIQPTIQQIWSWLDEVPDPEIPVISLTELGIIRDVNLRDATWVITVTPTYSGCPATLVINQMIANHLRNQGVESLRIEQRLSPPWTTDWLSREGRRKLKEFGIAPPMDGTAASGQSLSGATRISVTCPHCGSTHTEKISQFGSTPCKASYRCRDCLEPFDYFKCI